MKRIPLVDNWSLALEAHGDGTHVGALLSGNALHADVLCCGTPTFTVALVRVHRGKRVTFESGQVRSVFQPTSATFDVRVWTALQRALIAEFEVPLHLRIGSPAGSEPVVVFNAPEVA